MLLSGFIRSATAALEKLYPSPEAGGIVFLLLQERLGTEKWTHIIEPERTIPEDRLPQLEEDLRRLCNAEPVQYVIGSAWFYGRQFRVTPAVLIPRPETELLVREAVCEALALHRPARILDLCTGSGCIAWSVALETTDAEVVATDISEEALEVAAGQFPGPSPLFVRSDVLDARQDFDHGSFDLILSNPPYVRESEKSQMRPNVLGYEPGTALFVPDEDPLLFYRAVALWAVRFLRPEGCGFVEINESLPGETESVFREAGFSDTAVLRDLAGKPRIVRFRR